MLANEDVVGAEHQRATNPFSLQSRKNRLDVAPLETFMSQEEKMEIRHLVHAPAVLPERFEFLRVNANKWRTDETSRSRKERRREHRTPQCRADDELQCSVPFQRFEHPFPNLFSKQYRKNGIRRRVDETHGRNAVRMPLRKCERHDSSERIRNHVKLKCTVILLLSTHERVQNGF